MSIHDLTEEQRAAIVRKHMKEHRWYWFRIKYLPNTTRTLDRDKFRDAAKTGSYRDIFTSNRRNIWFPAWMQRLGFPVYWRRAPRFNKNNGMDVDV